MIDFKSDLKEQLFKSQDKETKKALKKFLNEEGKILKKETIQLAKIKVKKGEKKKDAKMRYNRRIKKGKTWNKNNTWQVRVYNNVPHAHLVEEGHNIVKNGRKIGRVEGKYIFRTTSKNFSQKFYKDSEKFLDDALERGLDF